jgi:hypothetical protein
MRIGTDNTSRISSHDTAKTAAGTATGSDVNLVRSFSGEQHEPPDANPDKMSSPTHPETLLEVVPGETSPMAHNYTTCPTVSQQEPATSSDAETTKKYREPTNSQVQALGKVDEVARVTRQ